MPFDIRRGEALTAIRPIIVPLSEKSILRHYTLFGRKPQVSVYGQRHNLSVNRVGSWKTSRPPVIG